MAAATKEILADLSPVLIHYADGTVDRRLGSPHVPPSPEDPATGVSSRDVTIPGSGVAPSARLYLPKNAGEAKKLPIIVYYHGGAFCVDSAFSKLNHSYATALSSQSGSLIVSVEYRLAPEHPLPAAYEDSWAALTWVCSHDDPWISNHGDPTKLFVAGDSAGGNIAHNMAMRAGWEALPGNMSINGAILGHPYFWGRGEAGHLCERLWLFAYPGCERGIENPMINPFGDGAPSLAGFECSRLMVYVAEKDVLKEWGLRYVEKVKQCGWNGSVVSVVVEGEDHCFQVFDPSTAKARDLITNIAQFIAYA